MPLARLCAGAQSPEISAANLRIGYDVMRVTLQPGQSPRMEPFSTGFLQGRSYWGRPVDLLMMRDGSVLVSDDLNGAIYRVARER